MTQKVSLQGLCGGSGMGTLTTSLLTDRLRGKRCARTRVSPPAAPSDQTPQDSLKSAVPSGSQTMGLCHGRLECPTPTERHDVITPQCRAAPSPANQ